MQTGISTACFFNKCYVEDALYRIAGCGTRNCEVFLNTFSEYEPDFIELVTNRIRPLGLTVYSLHPMGSQFEPQLFSIYSRQRDDALRIFERVLQAGNALGAQCYVLHGPANMGGIVKNMEFARIGPIVRDLCAAAKAYGMTIAWENVSWCLFHTPEFGMRLQDASQTDDLRFTLDLKQAARSGYSALDYIGAVGAYLANVHVCGFHSQNGRVVPLLPAADNGDLPAVAQALRECRYTGPAFLEVYSDLFENDTALCQSYQYMDAVFNS